MLSKQCHFAPLYVVATFSIASITLYWVGYTELRRLSTDVNQAGFQRMLLAEHESGRSDHRLLLLERQQYLDSEYGSDTVQALLSYFDGASAYSSTKLLLNKNVGEVEDKADLWALVVAVMGTALALCDACFVLWHGLTLVRNNLLIDSKDAQSNRYERLLKLLSHDFKGTIVNVLAEIERHSLQDSMIEALMHHVAHTIESLKYRTVMVLNAEQDDKIQAKVCPLAPIARNLQKLFPQLELLGSMNHTVQFTPSLLHTACYQVVRNATVHGGGEVQLEVHTEADHAVLSFTNNPGENHVKMVSLGDKALDFALSGQAGIISSSGLGLQDIMEIVNSQPNCRFSIHWEPDHVVATIRIPLCLSQPTVLARPENSPGNQTILDIRVCVIDDQLGPRLQATKLIPQVNPHIEYKAPKERTKNNGVWQDKLVKVGGASLLEIDECIEWVNLDPRRTIAFLDRMLEYPGQTIDGLDLIPKLIRNGAVVLMRSGNDSDSDKQMYLDHGAFGSVGKMLIDADVEHVIRDARAHILTNQTNDDDDDVTVIRSVIQAKEHSSYETNDVAITLQSANV